MMTKLAFLGVICLVTLCIGGVESQEENTFIIKGDQYPTSGEDENVIKSKNPFFIFADRDGRSKGLWGRSRNSLETNEVETEKRPLFVFRPYYTTSNSQFSLQPPHSDAKPIFEIRKKRDVSNAAQGTADGTKSTLISRIKRAPHKCRKCEKEGGYAVAPVYIQPVYTQPVYVKPVIAEPVYTQPVHVKPVHVKPVVAEPVYAKPSHGGCDSCGGGYGGHGGYGGSYSFSQSSASSSSGSFGYGK